MTRRVAVSLWSVPEPAQDPTLSTLRTAGLDHVHWDLTDGVFAAAGGFPADRARTLTAAHGLRAEAHLMVTDPLAHVDAWTDFCELVVVHAETPDHLAALRRIEKRGARAGLALSPGTPADVVPPGELAVLVMSIVPGQAGSTFTPSTLGTVRELRTGDPDRLVGLDGGVQRRHLDDIRQAGASWLVSGTDLTGAGDPAGWLADARA
ncbi:hypothetical protein JL107_15985 [Nakamurella flavida]|uniref:Ribulose-phosphate 3-epimerase n=1 Tax=Nakamurella flavida TaxID=363630 RepID=A0A938YR72_9ACTN|nr:hypothetical protein [Nakamurella flavida]MBM9477949.1 hypothetical protein [Nakamurella flavida]MDP9778335.1 ribulose-phosphate 3-epimerase [Nakamurella flavida]